MTDPGTFTSEHRSWQWELVMQYEDGSLPASEWNEPMLSAVAQWYAKNLPREQAVARYTQAYERNRRRLSNRLGSAAVATEALEALDKIWESLLARSLDANPSS